MWERNVSVNELNISVNQVLFLAVYAEVSPHRAYTIQECYFSSSFSYIFLMITDYII